MAILLSLETSTPVGSVALHRDGALIARAETSEPQAHGSQLALLADRVVAASGLGYPDIQAVAITAGPGSYTGLRIGTSTAKGLCFALGIPLIALGSLELLAYQGSMQNPSGALLCPMIDARRMEVYCLVADPALRPVMPVAARIIDETSFSELLDSRPMLFFGDGAAKCRQVLRHSNAQFLNDIVPLAAHLGPLAEQKFQKGSFEDLVQFSPLYLKEFAAKKARTGV